MSRARRGLDTGRMTTKNSPSGSVSELQPTPHHAPENRLATFPGAFLHTRTWREYAYICRALLLAPFAFVYAVFVPTFTAATLVTVVALWLSGVLVVAGRGWGAAYRSMARTLLDEDVADPPRFVRPRGFWRATGAMLGDVDGWRALLFSLLTFPLAILGFVISTTFLVAGLGGVTYWIWYRFLPLEQAPDGTLHRGAQFSTDATAWFVDTPPRIALAALVGVVCLVTWPWVQRLFIAPFRQLTRALLGPSSASLRLAQARASQAATVEDSDTRLRRIERDLHDGTQARLVAVAMQLGEAREYLATGGDPALAADLLDTAHSSTKEALTELREIARGIHPPALDSGLAVALETLAARSPLPVNISVDPSVEAAGPLAPAIQSIAYYSVAELVTNAAKHAQATTVWVLVDRDGPSLRLRVRDDGRGGAAVSAPDGDGRRTGLAGLDERVRAVDGTFALSSPAGGPTVVTVTLPTSARP